MERGAERGLLYIDGRWVDTGRSDVVTEKYTGQALAAVAQAGPEHVAEAVAAAQAAFERAQRAFEGGQAGADQLTPHRRYEILIDLAARVRERREEVGLLIAREAGKPLQEARQEVDRAVQTIIWSAEEAKRITGETVPVEGAPGGEGRIAFTIRVPVGVVAAITPFNYPLNLVVHKVAPALAAGCTVVLKPAVQTPLTAVELARMLHNTGLPPGHFNLVMGGAEVGEALVRDPRVAMITFTGSAPVGEKIQAAAGLRRVTLELGNNSATIVHGDADLARAARACARRGFANAGQVCTSVQRIYVRQEAVEPFTRLLVEETQKLRVGDPTDPATDVGPMISEDAARRAEKWVREAVEGGARVLCGGRRDGALFFPTVLDRVTPDMRVVCEEVFAPVVTVQPYAEIADAIAAVNQSPYGLRAGIFTQSLPVALAAARGIRVGSLIVNDTSSFRVDHMPSGGVKRSGTGREGPRYAIDHMTEERLIVCGT